MITVEDDSRDVDNAIGCVLVSLCSLFPTVPMEYVAIFEVLYINVKKQLKFVNQSKFFAFSTAFL